VISNQNAYCFIDPLVFQLMHSPEQPGPPMDEKDTRNGKSQFSKLRWSLIGLYAFIIVFLQISKNPLGSTTEASIYALTVFVLAGLHGRERYGLKNIGIFLLVTWAISLFFEALSVETGIPFGHYHYSMQFPISLFGVPLVIIVAYFGAGYFSWMLSHVLTGQFSKKLQGKWIFVIPFIAACILVMWDICLDPILSTVLSFWVWESPGPYFGVPITNFVGWFVIGFAFYQLFALYLSRYDRIRPQKVKKLASKPYWLEAAIVYGLIGFTIIITPVAIYNDITVSMALVTVFTMIFVAIISLIAIMNNNELR
jgi:putative membrane protein